jgi:carboxymethylenebutenolidase
MAGTTIEITAADGGKFKAYLAVPKSGKGPGIVLCQEIFGINAYIREVADYYAEEGYVVLAPDLFWRIQPGIELGYSEEEWKKAFGLFQEFDTDKGMQDITGAVRVLRTRNEVVGKVGALGFCLGGRLAYLAAARSGVDCAVAYYGVTIDRYLGDAARIKVPMVLHFAEQDKYAPPEKVESIKAATTCRSTSIPAWTTPSPARRLRIITSPRR